MRAYDAENIRLAKAAVFANAPIPSQCVSHINPAIVDSWIEGRDNGIDPNVPVLPSTTIDYSAKDRLTSFKLFALQQGADYYDAKHALMASLGVATYYLDDRDCVIHHGGCSQLLRELRALGFKFGTSFDSNSIGINCTTKIALQPPLNYVLGEEHYLSILAPFGACAVPILSKHTKMSEVLFFRMDQYCPQIVQFIDLVYYLEIFHTRLFDPNIGPVTDGILEVAGFLNMGKHTILTDTDGIILDTNSGLGPSFGTTPEHIIGEKFDIVIPELSSAWTVLSTRRSRIQRIRIDRPSSASKIYQMSAYPAITNGTLLGMIVELLAEQPKDSKARTRYSFSDIIGECPAFTHLKMRASVAAQSTSSIIITGETGSGKELFAQAIHDSSRCASGPFIAVNCGAIPAQLVGSELFGYDEGAFTGAKKGGAPGKFELANGGTLFLDEIAEMPLDMQSVLLRVLEEGKVTRLGSQVSRPIDVRIISATNQDLKIYIQKGNFRSDLYYRLNVIKLEIIPLRDRREDIPLLAHHFLKKVAHTVAGKPTILSDAALNLLMEYSWPGNLRELRNAIESAVNMAGDRIEPDDFPKEIRGGIPLIEPNETAEHAVRPQPLPAAPAPAAPPYDPSSTSSYDVWEQERIRQLMIQFGGNKKRVAQEMNIARTTLYRKLKKLNWL